MHATFADVMWIVCGLGIVAALFALAGSGKSWDAYAKRGLFMESSQGQRQTPLSVNSLEAERVDEIRQLVEASNNRRARRGEAPVDVDSEVERLMAADAAATEARRIDPEVEDEIRALVGLRNQRRVKRGQPPLDVESEVAREVAALGSLAAERTRG